MREVAESHLKDESEVVSPLEPSPYRMQLQGHSVGESIAPKMYWDGMSGQLENRHPFGTSVALVKR